MDSSEQALRNDALLVETKRNLDLREGEYSARHLADLPMETLFCQPMPLWKRTLDIVGASVGIVIFALPMLLVALVIKLTSRGPVLFLQDRAGIGGRPFKLYKFRTMVVDAESRKQDLLGFNARTGPAFKMKNDPRVTSVGRFLRKFSLDELPQFFNVLEGNMSLVGPRPLPLREEQLLTGWHRMRRDVRPGITCIWQVKSRDESCFDSWVRQDVQYIRRMSAWLDLKLLLQTIPAVLIRKGSLE